MIILIMTNIKSRILMQSTTKHVHKLLKRWNVDMILELPNDNTSMMDIELGILNAINDKT